MRARLLHNHPCHVCGTPVDCDDRYEGNEDGWPEALCPSYHHTWGAINPDWLCEVCQDQRAESARVAALENEVGA